MIRYEERKPMKDVTQAELSKAAAKKLTQKIKTAVDDLWSLLVQAHEGRAWKALGYQTWEAYVSAEFSMSRRRSYQLIDKGNVIQAIAEATGENVQHVAQISARDVETVKDDLPVVTDEIKAKVEAGEEPEKATEETIAYHRAAKAKLKAEREAKRKKRQAQQAENDRQREEHVAALPQHIKDREQAKAEWRLKASAGQEAEQLQDRISELEEAVRVLEGEAEELRAENKLYREMKVQFEQGGFEKVVADRDELIRAQGTRIEAESRDKVLWMNRAKFWKDEAIKLGWKNGDFTVDIETGEIADV